MGLQIDQKSVAFQNGNASHIIKMSKRLTKIFGRQKMESMII